MEHKIPGSYYLVEVPKWNEAGFTVAQYTKTGQWIDICSDFQLHCTSHVKSYKALDKVGKMHPFAVLSITKLK